MAYKISDECIACGACAAECPVEAISEGDDKYVIDEDLCVECGACTYICPGRLHLTHAFKTGKAKIQAYNAALKAREEAAKAKEEEKKEAK